MHAVNDNLRHTMHAVNNISHLRLNNHVHTINDNLSHAMQAKNNISHLRHANNHLHVINNHLRRVLQGVNIISKNKKIKNPLIPSCLCVIQTLQKEIVHAIAFKFNSYKNCLMYIQLL